MQGRLSCQGFERERDKSMTDNERYEYEKIITDLYSYIANQSVIIEKLAKGE